MLLIPMYLAFMIIASPRRSGHMVDRTTNSYLLWNILFLAAGRCGRRWSSRRCRGSRIYTYPDRGGALGLSHDHYDSRGLDTLGVRRWLSRRLTRDHQGT
jgi:hypothetical protein